MSIVDVLGYGKDAALSRETLVMVLGVCDRQVRQQIADARANGCPIVNDGDGEGYYITDDPVELRKQMRLNSARVAALMRQQYALGQSLKHLEGRG